MAGTSYSKPFYALLLENIKLSTRISEQASGSVFKTYGLEEKSGSDGGEGKTAEIYHA